MKRIAILEKNRKNLEELVIALNRAGYKTLSYSRANDLPTLIRSSKPDLVLSNLNFGSYEFNQDIYQGSYRGRRIMRYKFDGENFVAVDGDSLVNCNPVDLVRSLVGEAA